MAQKWKWQDADGFELSSVTVGPSWAVPDLCRVPAGVPSWTHASCEGKRQEEGQGAQAPVAPLQVVELEQWGRMHKSPRGASPGPPVWSQMCIDGGRAGPGA